MDHTKARLRPPTRYAFLVTLLATGLCAHAQTWPTYTATKLQPLMSGATALDTTAWALNNAGTVVGWAARPAGTKAQYAFTYNAAGFPNLFGPYDVSRVSIFTASPVIWNGTQAKELPRVSNSYNTLARDIADDGAILMEVADTTAKSTSMSGDMQGNGKSHWRIYKGGTFKIPMISGARIPATGAEDKVNTYFGPASELVYNPGGTAIKIWANDRVQQVQLSAADGLTFTKAQLTGLWPGSQGWLTTEGTKTDPSSGLSFTSPGCQSGVIGQFNEFMKAQGIDEFRCLAMNRQGVVFGEALKKERVYLNAGGSYFELRPAGYYMIEGGTWKRIALLDGKGLSGPVLMDEQGRVATRASVFDEEPKVRPILIHQGVARPLQDLVDTPIQSSSAFVLADMNEKGQMLIWLLNGKGFDHLLLTPR